MKQLLGLLLLAVAVTACNSGGGSNSKKMPEIKDISTSEVVAKKPEFPALEMEAKLLFDTAPLDAKNLKSAPSVFPISDSLSLIEHLGPDHDRPQWSFYDAYGNFIYSTLKKVTYYSIGDSHSLVQESENGKHQFYFIFNHSFENLDKQSAMDFECEKDFIIKQSDEREAIKIECEKDGHYLIADFSLRSITLRSSDGFLGRRYDPFYYWVRLAPTNISYRNTVENHNDFKLHFTPITDKNVLPIKENSYGSKFMTAQLKKFPDGDVLNQELIIKNQTRANTLKVSLKTTSEGNADYSLSYIVLAPNRSYEKRLILKEQSGDLYNPNINLISLIPFKDKATSQNSLEIICNFCDLALKEGKHLQNPAPYKACIDHDFNKYSVDNYISVTENNSIIVQISTTTPDMKKFKGAIIMDPRLNIKKTYEMQDYSGDSLKFMSNSNSIYSTTSTSLFKYDQNGKIQSAVDFCALIPNCSPKQNKTIISLKNGRFIFTQALESSNDVKANELIYELLVR